MTYPKIYAQASHFDVLKGSIWAAGSRSRFPIPFFQKSSLLHTDHKLYGSWKPENIHICFCNISFTHMYLKKEKFKLYNGTIIILLHTSFFLHWFLTV